MMDILGRKLFPRDAEWERRRKLNTALLVGFVAAGLGVIVATLILYSGYRVPH
jgi:hypothetical protein